MFTSCARGDRASTPSFSSARCSPSADGARPCSPPSQDAKQSSRADGWRNSNVPPRPLHALGGERFRKLNRYHPLSPVLPSTSFKKTASRSRAMTPSARSVASPHAVSIADLRGIASRRLPRAVFDYLDGGAEGE